MDKGLQGQIPQPNGWVLPERITDMTFGNTEASRRNRIRGPIPPAWKLPPSA